MSELSDLQIQNEITRLEAQVLAIKAKSLAFNTVAGLSAFYIAYRQKKTFWVKGAYSICGGMAGYAIADLLYANELNTCLAQISNLKRIYNERHPQLSLYEDVTNNHI